MQTPPARGSSAASSAWRGSGTRARARRAQCLAEQCGDRQRPCSDVPQPVTTIGSPALAARVTAAAMASAPAAAAIGSASPGSASIISSITHGGPSRSSG